MAPVSRRMRRSVTPESFHVFGIGTEVGRRVLVNADQAKAVGHVQAGLPGNAIADVLLQDLPDDDRWPHAFLSGFSLQFLLEPLIDPHVDPFHTSLYWLGDCQTMYHVCQTDT